MTFFPSATFWMTLSRHIKKIDHQHYVKYNPNDIREGRIRVATNGFATVMNCRISASYRR